VDDTRHRLLRGLIAATAALTLGVGITGCSLVTGQNYRDTGNSADENQELAAEIPDQITDTFPESSVLSVNYRDDITLTATLSMSVRVADLPSALAAVADTPIPDLPEFTDPGRPLAPIAARLVQMAWDTEIEPIQSLTVEVRLEGDAQSIDTWNLGIDDSDDTAALENAFGPRP
jgi:hypothetical protein